MSDLAEALDLLEGIDFRDRITEEERIPAWRAIKLLYRAGVPEADCHALVRAISSLGKPYAHGPTLHYHVNHIRMMLERGELRPRDQPSSDSLQPPGHGPSAPSIPIGTDRYR